MITMIDQSLGSAEEASVDNVIAIAHSLEGEHPAIVGTCMHAYARDLDRLATASNLKDIEDFLDSDTEMADVY